MGGFGEGAVDAYDLRVDVVGKAEEELAALELLAFMEGVGCGVVLL